MDARRTAAEAQVDIAQFRSRVSSSWRISRRRVVLIWALARLRPAGWRLLSGSRLALWRARAQARTLKLVALGDSLTAGLGLPPDQAFPDVLQAALKAKGCDVEVINAGVSGDTAADGLARYDWSVPEGRGRADRRTRRQRHAARPSPDGAKAALAKILERARQAHLATLLAGMRAAPNLGRRLSGASTRSIPISPSATASRSIRSSSTASPTTPSSTRRTALHPTRGRRRDHRRAHPAGGRGRC